ncbi:hypothetical protein Tco_1454618 [Tanacetum coccineum]
MMDVDYKMAQQLQAEEQKQLSIEEKLKLFVQLLEARKKHFAEMRARKKRNKPPTQAQQRKLYCNYLVEKRYPFTPATITGMLNKKLQADHLNEICYQLLKLMTKQLKNPGSV